MNFDINFYKNKTVLITGHTGFKGTWLCSILLKAGANVVGYALVPKTNPNLFELANIKDRIRSFYGDIRDYDSLYSVFASVQPEIVFHLAAQPIVRDGYKDPKTTFETNIMGTVNLLECVRHFPCVKSVVNVTTDKVYKNNEWTWGYRENEPLNGFDPYSNSKSCSELITDCYRNSFFLNRTIGLSTTRAGNVIGGGDFSPDRIIPDCLRAIEKGETIGVRNPFSVRPYQYVLEPLFVYLLIAAKQYDDCTYQGCYNVGPDDSDALNTGELVDLFCKLWGDDAKWANVSEINAPHEANYLRLDCSKLKSTFRWKPTWHIEEAVARVCDFNRVLMLGGNITEEMEKEISEYLEAFEVANK